MWVKGVVSWILTYMYSRSGIISQSPLWTGEAAIRTAEGSWKPVKGPFLKRLPP